MKCRECNKDLDYGPFVQLHGTHDYFCYRCMPSMQPERLNPEDKNWFGMKAEMKDGLCYFEDGRIIDPSQPINVSDSPTTENKQSP